MLVKVDQLMVLTVIKLRAALEWLKLSVSRMEFHASGLEINQLKHLVGVSDDECACGFTERASAQCVVCTVTITVHRDT